MQSITRLDCLKDVSKTRLYVDGLPSLYGHSRLRGLLKTSELSSLKARAVNNLFLVDRFVFVVDLLVFVDRRLAFGHQAGFAGVISSPSAGYDFV